jgi:hypothetical protein
MKSERPNVKRLMLEIEAAAKLVERDPITVRAPRKGRSVFVPTNPAIEANWDSWIPPVVSSHRKIGAPIVWLKQASLFLLRMHDRELLKRQRDFNREVMNELNALKRAVIELSMENQSRP